MSVRLDLWIWIICDYDFHGESFTLSDLMTIKPDKSNTKEYI